MSIDFLQDLERAVENGKEMFASPNIGRNQWMISDNDAEVEKVAVRAANNRKMSVNLVRLVSKLDALVGNSYLVPTKIGEPGPRGEAVVEWSVVETREAAEMMRDLRRGPAPYFAMQVEKVIEPAEALE
jgi:hypothetical protein